MPKVSIWTRAGPCKSPICLGPCMEWDAPHGRVAMKKLRPISCRMPSGSCRRPTGQRPKTKPLGKRTDSEKHPEAACRGWKGDKAQVARAKPMTPDQCGQADGRVLRNRSIEVGPHTPRDASPCTARSSCITLKAVGSDRPRVGGRLRGPAPAGSVGAGHPFQTVTPRSEHTSP